METLLDYYIVFLLVKFLLVRGFKLLKVVEECLAFGTLRTPFGSDVGGNVIEC